MALPFDLENGADADATQLMANLNYLLGLITAATGNFPGYASDLLAAEAGATIYQNTATGFVRHYNAVTAAWQTFAEY